ncbi:MULTISPECIES: UDP-glucose/GDP-mannose dehydrogenase family protein [unclassified Minwuia]|jgi:UDPglucose 6-dehydrogenase|uniref:UDP-glucose dehydrogenase family protein n=1 Tax=unclassified Minwuia TaxID=2618799 RepID=UPI002478D0A0|nr:MULTISPECIES: UDP-glucose/GDP-mannose dehydrogenase family protein [unclassified Minwuia]
MKVAMIGTGYVGLVSGACFSEFGHDVICVDKDADKIARLLDGVMPIFEPGLDNLVARNVEAGRLRFTTDLDSALADIDAVFIAVGTPSRRGAGDADLSYVYGAAEEVARAVSGYTVVVTKSTVPVGTGAEVKRILAKANPTARFDVVSNPEFLREGAAIEDFMRPNRIVCGVESEKAEQVMRDLYRPLFLNETPMVFTTLETSELIKYAANCFLATKITFINEIASLCEQVGGDVQAVARGIGLDKRIGNLFLHAGPGYGGSCFPKDIRALIATAEQNGSPLRIIEAVDQVNEDRKRAMAQKIIDAFGGDVAGKTIAVLGVTFKPNTDDMRESPSLDILPALQKAGASLRAHDPEGMEEAAKMMPGITWCDDAYDAMKGADGATILTEWNAYRALDLDRVKGLLSEPLLVDLRNIYALDEMRNAGLRYVSVGRRTVD